MWARTLILVLVVAALPWGARAQSVIGIKGPVTSIVPVPIQNGWRLDYCPGTFGNPVVSIPLEWEIQIHNPGDAPITVGYTDQVTDGYNGDGFSLICPPTLLPLGVDPLIDVDCNANPNELTIRNIQIDTCQTVRLRLPSLGGMV